MKAKVLFSLILLCTVVVCSERASASTNFLYPCPQYVDETGTLSKDLWARYEELLWKVFISRVPKNGTLLFSVFILPDFKAQESIIIYRDSENNFIVESLKMNKDLWSLVIDNKNIGESDMQVTSRKSFISEKAALTASRILSHMTSNVSIPKPSKRRFIHRSLLMYISGEEWCGFTYGVPTSGNLKSLVKITDWLDEYVKSDDQKVRSALEERICDEERKFEKRRNRK